MVALSRKPTAEARLVIVKGAGIIVCVTNDTASKFVSLVTL
jgi:hypothetical protein